MRSSSADSNACVARPTVGQALEQAGGEGVGDGQREQEGDDHALLAADQRQQLAQIAAKIIRSRAGSAPAAADDDEPLDHLSPFRLPR